MNNLFSIFDPIVSYFPFNWVSTYLFLVVLPQIYWISTNQFKYFFFTIINFVYTEFMSILGILFNPGRLLISLALFMLIILNNFLGLFSYVFTASSHLTLTVRFALPLWLGHILLAWFKTPIPMLAHLLPLGTPIALTPFIVVIELIRRLIRPLTLSVRLAANIVAGHLLLTLLRSQAISLNFLFLVFLFTGLILLIILESAVALIQAYVFRVLSTLYLNEVNSLNLS